MLSDELIRDLIRDASLDWHQGYVIDSEDNRYLELARAIEREATAEAVRLLTELVEAELAPYPPYQAGKQAQDEWAKRKARAVLAAATFVERMNGSI